MLALSVPALAVSLAHERRFARAGGTPLLDLSLFRSRSFRTGLGISSAFMAWFISSVFVLSLLLQDGQQLSPLQAGLSFAPMALLGIAGALLGRRVITRYGPARTIQAGCAIYAAATLLLALVLQTQHAHASLAWLIMGLAFMGLGGVLILPAMIGATLTDVTPAQAAVASGTLTTIQQFAGTAGLAAIGSTSPAWVPSEPDQLRRRHRDRTLDRTRTHRRHGDPQHATGPQPATRTSLERRPSPRRGQGLDVVPISAHQERWITVTLTSAPSLPHKYSNRVQQLSRFPVAVSARK